jgi:hypothetical protein
LSGIDFTKGRPPDDDNSSVLASDKLMHETLRKAIDCTGEDESIVLSLEAAMALIMEWDYRGEGK